MKEWAKGTGTALMGLLQAAEDYRRAASHEALGMMSGSAKAAQIHDQAKYVFQKQCAMIPGVVAEGLCRLRDALREEGVR